jgi:XRE family transcriptional regulator, aerobic/anaerobic benzoate catabolism transcriptional regulator
VVIERDRTLAGLAKRCRELRSEHGLTLRELAARSGLSPRFLVQVESGQGNISVRNLAHLARALGSTPSALLAEPAGAAERPFVALLGLRGSGKTTIGRRLARRMRLPFVELDRRIEESAGLSLAEIFALHGENYYRRLEKDALEQLLAEGRPAVLATGGGIVTSPDTYQLLRRRAATVWLRAQAEDYWNRVVQQGDRRPLDQHPRARTEFRRLLAVREPLYAQAAHIVDTSRLGVDAVVQAILALVGSPKDSGAAD